MVGLCITHFVEICLCISNGNPDGASCEDWNIPTSFEVHFLTERKEQLSCLSCVVSFLYGWKSQVNVLYGCLYFLSLVNSLAA